MHSWIFTARTKTKSTGWPGNLMIKSLDRSQTWSLSYLLGAQTGPLQVPDSDGGSWCCWHQLSYAIKTQLKAPKARGISCLSLCLYGIREQHHDPPSESRTWSGPIVTEQLSWYEPHEVHTVDKQTANHQSAQAFDDKVNKSLFSDTLRSLLHVVQSAVKAKIRKTVNTWFVQSIFWQLCCSCNLIKNLYLCEGGNILTIKSMKFQDQGH